MSSMSAHKHWQAISAQQKVEVCVIQVDISYDRRMYSQPYNHDMHCVEGIVRSSFYAIAEVRGGKLLSWHGEGGGFMFLIEDDSSVDNACLAAIQMLEMTPSINEDIRLSADVACPMQARILCDVGMVAYDPEPARTAGDFVDALLQHRRRLSADKRVTITDRVYCRLSAQFRSRFASCKYSPELDIDLHHTVPLEEAANLSDAQHPSSQPPVAESDLLGSRLSADAAVEPLQPRPGKDGQGAD